jgi:hypothetical protein
MLAMGASPSGGEVKPMESILPPTNEGKVIEFASIA